MPHSFNPIPRTLMGPGPSDVHPRILAAMARPTIGHLDPQFIVLMDEIKSSLQYAFQTQNPLTIALSAPGSAGMECCFVNLLKPGDKVIVCQNGVFGGRMKENIERCGGIPVLVTDDWGQPVSVEKVADALKAHPDAVALAFVHAETSTGAASDVAALCQLAREYGCFSIVDTVTGLAGVPVQVDDWGVDAIYSGSQKCLSCVPGLSPVSFSPKAVERIQQLSESRKVQSWFLDMNLVMGYWGGAQKRAYHHTAPINPLYALHEALVMLEEEGLEARFARHRQAHLALKAGVEMMGLAFLVPEKARLPQLNSILVPEGVNEALIRQQLLTEFQLEIGAGLGVLAGKVWRIGLMGYSARLENVFKVLAALSVLLSRQGYHTDSAALAAAEKAWQEAA